MKMSAEQIIAAYSAGGTQRFHTRPTLKSQSVAAHAHGVALLCCYLAGGAPSAALLMAALTHDHGEYWTGDVPAPVKHHSAEVEKIFEELEATHLAKNTGILPLELSDEESLALSLADKLEGLLYIRSEQRLGNKNLDQSAYRYGSYIWSIAQSRLNEPVVTRTLELLQKLEYLPRSILQP